MICKRINLYKSWVIALLQSLGLCSPCIIPDLVNLVNFIHVQDNEKYRCSNICSRFLLLPGEGTYFYTMSGKYQLPENNAIQYNTCYLMNSCTVDSYTFVWSCSLQSALLHVSWIWFYFLLYLFQLHKSNRSKTLKPWGIRGRPQQKLIPQYI